MTEDEMSVVRDILYDCGEVLALFDERTQDKKILFVTADEPTMLRYIIDSPVFTEAEKERAESTLGNLIDHRGEGSLRPAPFQLVQDLFAVDGDVIYSAPTEPESEPAPPEAKRANSATESRRYTVEHVAHHVYDTDDTGSFATMEEVRDWLADEADEYLLLPIPLPCPDDERLMANKVHYYAQGDTPFPPVVMGILGEVADGNHRVAAAKLRGDTTIMAYVPQPPFKREVGKQFQTCEVKV